MSAVRGTVLDAGCGHGYATCDIASVTPWVTAIDMSPKFLDRAKDLATMNGHDNISFVLGDACSLPFDDQSFDTVTLLEILEHLEHPESAVGEALRIARRRVVVTVPAHGHMTNVSGHINDFTHEDLLSLFPLPVTIESCKPFTFVVCDCASLASSSAQSK